MMMPTVSAATDIHAIPILMLRFLISYDHTAKDICNEESTFLKLVHFNNGTESAGDHVPSLFISDVVAPEHVQIADVEASI
jgi:hypothetical protein